MKIYLGHVGYKSKRSTAEGLRYWRFTKYLPADVQFIIIFSEKYKIYKCNVPVATIYPRLDISRILNNHAYKLELYSNKIITI